MLPESLYDIEQRRAHCLAQVKHNAIASSGASLVPVPGVDILADVGMLLRLIPSINHHFGLTPEQIAQHPLERQTKIRQLIEQAGAEMVGVVISKHLVLKAIKKVALRVAAAEFLHLIPFAGETSAAALSYGAMRYLGNHHVDVCCTIVRNLLPDTSTNA